MAHYIQVLNLKGNANVFSSYDSVSKTDFKIYLKKFSNFICPNQVSHIF